MVSSDVREAVIAGLLEAGAAFETTADLCSLAAGRDPSLRELAEAADLRIAACYPRAVRWLFDAAGATLAERNVRFFNLRTDSAEEITQGLVPGAPAGQRRELKPADNDETTLWFPLIDYDRCVDCKQCLNFCLFGVFGLSDDGKVQVQRPGNCKPNCPACARVCPEAAIIFPKYSAGGVIAGDEVTDAEAEGIRVDLQEILAGDVYAALRSRSECSCGQTAATGTHDEAEKSPRPAISPKLQELLEIPPDVIRDLPCGKTDPPCSCDRQIGDGKRP